MLLPVRNAATSLPGALRSVRRQTATDWECVVVDDGSDDDSFDVVRAHAADDARIVPLPRPAAGLVPALAAGLDACRGGLIARMDADDVMHRDRLAAQAARFDGDPDLDLLGTHVRLFPRAGLRAGWRAYERWVGSIRSAEDVRRNLFVECPVVHPTLVARAGVLRDLGYRDRGWPEDYDLVLRAVGAGRRVAVEPRRLLSWRRSPGALSTRDPRYGDDAFSRCKAHFLVQGPLATAGRYRLWGYGGTGRSLARHLADLGRSPSLVVDVHPGRLGATVRGGAPVVPPETVGPPDGDLLLASVAGAGPRDRIRTYLAERGFVEGRHFLCVA